MKNKSLIWIIITIIIVALVYFAYLQMPASQEEEMIEQTPALEEEVPSVFIVELSVENNSGQAGLVIFTEMGNTTHVRLDISGAPEGVPQPSHIHAGSCEELGAIKYPFPDSLNGFSETILNTPFSSIFEELPLAINVHKSASEMEVSVACGNIRVN